MKKQERKKMNNKGFSLVELIVVVAIMAVLAVVIAPQYTRYVEKTRLQKDNSALAEVAHAMKIAMADESVNSNTADGKTITFTNAEDTDITVSFTAANGELDEELSYTIGSFTTSSNAYSESDVDIKFTVTKEASTGIVKISATGWIENVGDTPIAADAELADQKQF